MFKSKWEVVEKFVEINRYAFEHRGDLLKECAQFYVEEIKYLVWLNK